MSEAESLFAGGDLSGALRARLREMESAAQAIPADRVLGRSVDELVAALVDEYAVASLELDWEGMTAEQTETPVDVRWDPLRAITDRSRPYYLPGTTITWFISFEGEADLFKYRPSSFTLSRPIGRVRDRHVEISYQGVNPEPETVRSHLDSSMAALRQWVGFVNGDVGPYNRSLPGQARAAVEARFAKVRADRDLVASLGVPLRRRADAPSTYVAPTIRRKPNIRPARPVGQRTAKLEPVLPADEYEHILGVIQNMVEVMERSPSAFAQMKEEHLRDHFLVQLNAQYEGGATGETFNFDGKTDILVRDGGRTIFIAECKFWDGPRVLAGTIDQLLSYSSWRDTKTAILLFNRTRALSTVLAKVPATVSEHSNFVRCIPQTAETAFRFVLHHRDDVERELTLTVLVFELPTGATK